MPTLIFTHETIHYPFGLCSTLIGCLLISHCRSTAQSRKYLLFGFSPLQISIRKSFFNFFVDDFSRQHKHAEFHSNLSSHGISKSIRYLEAWRNSSTEMNWMQFLSPFVGNSTSVKMVKIKPKKCIHSNRLHSETLRNIKESLIPCVE